MSASSPPPGPPRLPAFSALDEIDPATTEIGAAVRVVHERLDEECTRPRWGLA